MNIDYNLIINYLWENITFETFFKFIVLYFFIIWISLIVWVIKDISNRTENIFLQIISLLIILLLTPFGIFIYLIIRPSKTLFEKYYEEIEDNLDTIEEIVEEKNIKEENTLHCYKCNYPVSHDFTFCPNCNVKLKIECTECHKIISSGWKNCPYCGKENKNIIGSLGNINKQKDLKEDIKNIGEKVGSIINEQTEFEKNLEKKE